MPPNPLTSQECEPAHSISRGKLLLNGIPGREGFLFYDGFNQPVHQAAPGLLGLLEGRRVVERWKPAIVQWMDDSGHFFNHLFREFAGAPQFEPLGVDVQTIRQMNLSPAAKNQLLFHSIAVLAGELERSEQAAAPSVEAVKVSASATDVSLNGTWIAYHRRGDGSYVEREMALPVNWELVPEIENYAGSLRFTKTLDIPWGLYGKQLYLSFSGVDYYADVWVNGHYAGGHEGSFAPFAFDISSYLYYGQLNVIRMTATSPNEPAGEGIHVNSGWHDFRHESSFPNRKTLIKGTLGHHDAKRGGAWSSLTSQDGNTGGVWNDINLCVRNPLHLGLGGPRVITHAVNSTPGSDDLTASVEIELPVHNATHDMIEAGLHVTVTPANFEGAQLELATTATLEPGPNQVSLWEPRLGPVRAWQPWDHGVPHLYSMRVVLEVGGRVEDELVLETGLRTLSISSIGESVGSGGAFVVNGTRVMVRGTNLLPTYWLSAYTQDKIETDFRMLRDAGFNAVMIHAMAAPKRLYEHANRQGLLVVQMFPLQWSYEQSLDFVERAKHQIRELTAFVGNEPSVVSYETHNEPDMRTTDDLDNRLVDLELHTTFRHADPHRWATTFSGGNHAYPGQFYDLRDDNSFSTLPARFEDAEFQGQRISRHQNMPTEFGIQAMPHVELFEELLAEDRVRHVLRRLRTDPKWRASGGPSWQETEKTLDGVKKLLGGGSWSDALRALDWRLLWRFDELENEITERKRYSGLTRADVDRKQLTTRWALLLLEVLHYGGFKGENFWFGRWKPARSLSEFVQSSQDRQYRLHKEAIETYLNASVLGPIVGYFSFMFRDSDRHAPTWGIVGADHAPKKAYRAYVESNQPVRMSLPRALQRSVKLPGDPWFGAQTDWLLPVQAPWTEAELIVANDTPRPVADGRIRLWLEDAAGGKVPFVDQSGWEVEGLDLNVDVGAGSGFSYFDRYLEAQQTDQPSRWIVPEELAGGTYYLKISLTTAQGEVLCTNSYELLVPETTFPWLEHLTPAQIVRLLDGGEGTDGFHYWHEGRVTHQAEPGVRGFLAGFQQEHQRGTNLYET
ncbi:MAG: hypothetical protein M3308_00675, partial [Actinomycetota bacterium]|nr:hypothetical protein [Actinomycetota bacterium]